MKGKENKLGENPYPVKQLPAVIRQLHHNSLITQSFANYHSMAKSRNTSPGVTVWNITQVETELTVQLLDCGACVCYPRHPIDDHDLNKIHVRSCFLLPSSLECYHSDLFIRVVHSKQLDSTFQMRVFPFMSSLLIRTFSTECKWE